MKRFVLITTFLVASLYFTSCNSKPPTASLLYDIDEDGLDPDRYDGDEVYICTGGSSKRYHNSKWCRGLENCSGDIERVYQDYAEDIGRTPCKLCY